MFNLLVFFSSQDIRLVADCFIVADKMIEESKKGFEKTIEAVAEEEAIKQAASLSTLPATTKKGKPEIHDEDDESVHSSKKDRKSKRQTTKNAAKPSGKAKKEDDDDETATGGNLPDILSTASLVVELQKSNEDAPFELLEAIAKIIRTDLVDSYRRVLNVKAQAIAASSAGDRKSTHKAVQEQISATVWLMRMFGRGIEHFPSGMWYFFFFSNNFIILCFDSCF